jgi:hypothetical protein
MSNTQKSIRKRKKKKKKKLSIALLFAPKDDMRVMP